MKAKITLIRILTYCLFSLFISNLAQGQNDYTQLMQKLARVDLLPEYMNEDIVRQISSYDTTGGNDDGFSGTYSYLRKEKDQLIIADIQGAGVIERIWTPTPTQDTILFFFDNNEEPEISLKFIDLFSGSKYPFVRPVVGSEVGGYYCYLPIPFEKGCKIVLKGQRMQFFQIQYREIHNSKIRTFNKDLSENAKLALERVIECWEKTGNEILDFQDNDKILVKEKSVLLYPGEKETIFEDHSGGRVIGIEILPQSHLNKEFKNLFIRAYWDEEKNPAIDCPLGDFFGYAFGEPSMRSMLAGVKEGIHYCNIPMPYSHKSKIELCYHEISKYSDQDFSFKVKIYYSKEAKKVNEGRLYTQWNRSYDPPEGTPYTIFDGKGSGHYVGTILQAQGLKSGMTIFFEGDDICTIDGEMRLHGTGSEDYFNGGWYALPDRWDQAFSLPVHGCLDYSIPLARTGGYRFNFPDKLSFKESINLTIEHGPENNAIPIDYTSVAFYYSDKNMSTPVPLDIDLLKAAEPPSLMEYFIQMLPINAISNSASVSKTLIKDHQSGNNYRVLKLTAPKYGYCKLQLDVPASGTYKLYLSYFKGPDCSAFSVNQRQIPVNSAVQALDDNYIRMEKEYIGEMKIVPGTSTITIVLQSHPDNAETGSFYLEKAFLEKISAN